MADFEANEGDFDNSTTEKGGGGGGEDEDEGGRRAGPKSEAENSLIATGAASDELKEENEKENQVTQPTDDFDVTDKDNQVGNESFSNMLGCFASF